jgi:hypothetical protein
MKDTSGYLLRMGRGMFMLPLHATRPKTGNTCHIIQKLISLQGQDGYWVEGLARMDHQSCIREVHTQRNDADTDTPHISCREYRARATHDNHHCDSDTHSPRYLIHFLSDLIWLRESLKFSTLS